MVVKVVRPRPRPEEEEGQAAVEETEEAVIAGKKNVYERERETEREKIKKNCEMTAFPHKKHHKIQISFTYSSSMLYNSI